MKAPPVFPLFALALLSGGMMPLPAQEPVWMATEARLWLKVPKAQPPLRDIRVSCGTATQALWENDPEVRVRHTDVLFPVRWWSWREFEIAFTPQHDGPVELNLNGPWAPEKGGRMPRQEILWDAITCAGGVILNGGFEKTDESGPAGWQAPWEAYLRPDAWPLDQAVAFEGSKVAASWSKRPLSQSLEVRAGVRITLRLHAMAATPPDFMPPARLGRLTPAHRAILPLKRGMNLGNGWEAPPGSGWGLEFTPEDIDRIADQGFDHIRVPVAWHHYLESGETGMVIRRDLLAGLEPVLRRALDRKLHVMLNWHHFHDFTSAPDQHLGRFISGWESIARHFRDWPPGLFFELLNEPCDALTTETANPIYQKVIRAIRASNPKRILVVSPGKWGNVSELDRLRLPDTEDRLIVTIHCYDPFHFTHQGASWVGLQDLRGVVYPGPPLTPLPIPPGLRDNPGVRAFLDSYNTLPIHQNPSSARQVIETLDAARAWSDHFGRPIHLGEFGAYQTGDLKSRSLYLRDVRSLAEQAKIPWALWEWKSGFGYWDTQTDQPRFRESLFGKSVGGQPDP
jgi:endoglucanase